METENTNKANEATEIVCVLHGQHHYGWCEYENGEVHLDTLNSWTLLDHDCPNTGEKVVKGSNYYFCEKHYKLNSDEQFEFLSDAEYEEAIQELRAEWIEDYGDDDEFFVLFPEYSFLKEEF